MAKTAAQITDEEMAIYRATARKQREQEKRQLLQKAEQARLVAEQVAKLLKEQFAVKRVILFGSLVLPESFHHYSDIDMAVEGLTARNFWRAWADLDNVSAGFEINLVGVEEATLPLLLEIKQKGVEL